MEPLAFLVSSTSKEEVERALEVGLAPAPITDARRRLRLWRGPAGRVLGRNRRFTLLAMIRSWSDLATARGPTQPLSHQPLLYRQQLQDREVLLHTWLHDEKSLRQGGETQQATLTRPCSEDLGDPPPHPPRRPDHSNRC
ncbi:hypothetical protein PAMP_005536 [Pampus punctatissimus]